MYDSDSDDDPYPSFPRLEEDNFFSWKYQMYLRLDIMGLRDVVSGKRAVPTDPIELWKWKQDAERAVCAICVNLGPSMLSKSFVRDNRDDPATLWVEIEKYHEPKRWPARFRAYNELLNARLEPGETLTSLFNRIEDSVYQLETLRKSGMTVGDLEDELFCVALVRGLGASDAHLLIDHQLFGPKLDMEKVRRMFGLQDSFRQRDQELNKSNRSCNFCGKSGHTEKRCYKRRRAIKRGQAE